MSKTERPARASLSKQKLLVIIAAVLLATALIVLAVFLIRRRILAPYVSFKTVYSEDIVSGMGIEYLPYPDGYLRVSRDGAEAVDGDGLRLWNISYSMNNPSAAVCGKYVSVADIGGTLVYVTDGSGNVTKVELPYTVEEVECSLAGVTAVRMNDWTDDYIRLVSIAGETIAEIKTVESSDGFPVDIALSPDAKKLVTSYVVINGDKSEGWLSFYNFGGVGKNYANNITGIFKHETVVSSVEFLDSSHLCAFLPSSVEFYAVSEVPSLKTTKTFDEKVLGFYPAETGLIAMLAGKGDGILSHTVAYDVSGNIVFDSSSGNEIRGVSFFGNNLLFYNETACQILSRSGGVVFNGYLEGAAVKKIIPLNGRDKLILLEENKVSTIQLTKGK